VDLETDRMALVSDLRGSRRDLASKATNVIAEVFVIVDGEYGLPKTPRVVSRFAILQWADVQSIAQQQLLVE
jgi:hypothetical protein